MQKYTYDWEIKDLLTQFLQAFDGAIIKRTDINGLDDPEVIAPRYVYSPKQRVLHDIVNQAQHATLPVVAFWVNSISRSPNRVFNKLEGLYASQNAYDTVSQHHLQPVPINIEVSVTILTRFQSDMDQMLCNFVPYCDPYFVISWATRDFPTTEIRTHIIWDNNLNMSYPTEQNPSQPTRVSCDTKFTIEGWLFKAQADAVGRIFKIDTNFYGVSATPTEQNIQYLTSPDTTESFVISATPRIFYSSRFETPIGFSSSTILQGVNFAPLTYVFLSGAAGMFPGATTYDPFSASNNSASYPPLSGVVIAQGVSITNDNTIVVTYQTPLTGGYFDIIVVNPAGYTQMTQTVYNANYTVQYPYVNGIFVVNNSISHPLMWQDAIITWDAATFQWQFA